MTRIVSDDQPENELYENIKSKIAAKQLPRENKKFMRCKECGQTGYRGEYPFSTCPASGRCDDCN